MGKHDYQRPIAKQPAPIMAELTAFVRTFCQQIGTGELVHPIVDSWNPEPVTTRQPQAAEA